MSIGDWLELTVLAGAWGMVGQLARVTIGLKKLYDEAESRGAKFTEVFSTARLGISLLIGIISGELAALSLLASDVIKLAADGSASVETTTIVGLMAAGYSGADFIEGVLSRYLPSTPAPSGPQASPSSAGGFYG